MYHGDETHPKFDPTEPPSQIEDGPMISETPRGVYRGRAGQLRRKPRAFYWDRAGIHAIVGAAVAGSVIGAAIGSRMHVAFLAFAAACLITFVFWRYEVSEDEAVNDERYSDIGGYLVGLFPMLPGLAIVANL